jgi:hypothetical protein
VYCWHGAGIIVKRTPERMLAVLMRCSWAAFGMHRAAQGYKSFAVAPALSVPVYLTDTALDRPGHVSAKHLHAASYTSILQVHTLRLIIALKIAHQKRFLGSVFGDSRIIRTLIEKEKSRSYFKAECEAPWFWGA